MYSKNRYSHFAVLGLGRFGMSIVQTLSEFNVDILVCDKDESKLQLATKYATHLVQADVSDENTVAKLGLGNFDVVILAMSKDFEASQIATMIAKENGATYIIVKAQSLRQKKILESIGADEVILPEREMGAKLAKKLASANIMDILEESEFYSITEMRPLDEWLNKTVEEADVRRKHNITILAVRRGSKIIIPVMPDWLITKEDVLIILTEKKKEV